MCRNPNFPFDFKLADVTSSNKKKWETSKDKHRPISILPNVSKIYEICIYSQMQQFFDNIHSKYQCNFCKSYKSLHYLFTMIEKWMTWKLIKRCFWRFINWSLKNLWLTSTWAFNCQNLCIWFWYETTKSHIQSVVQ